MSGASTEKDLQSVEKRNKDFFLRENTVTMRDCCIKTRLVAWP